MTWDPFQREVLAALGLRLYVPAATPREAPVAEVSPPRAPDPAARRGDAALLAALARAAGVTVEALPPLDLPALRTPAAKRALWPTLRALRRARH